MAGFYFVGRESHAAPTIQRLQFADTETLTKGDLANLQTGELDLAATNDSTLLGVVQETKAGTDSTTWIDVIVDADAIYETSDASIRLSGATLDVSGATGAQTVTTSSSKDFIVVSASTATQATRVKINPVKHATGGTAA